MASERNVLQGPLDGWRPPSGSLGAHLQGRLQSLGDRVLQEYPLSGDTLTASELVARSRRLAAALRASGVVHGDVVAFLCVPTVHFPPLMLATLCVGATIAPINHRFDTGDLERLLTNLQPRAVFTVPEDIGRLEKILLKIKSKPKLIQLGEGASWENFLKAATTSDDFWMSRVEDVENHIAFIMCSSGTTGLPKSVTLSHSSLHAYLQMMRREESSISGNDTVLIGTPLFWISGIIFQLLSMDLGAKLVIVPSFQDELFLDMIQLHKITFLFAPSHYAIVLGKYSNVGKYDLSSLQYVCCGGTAMSKDMQLFVEAGLGIKVSQWYGMTEILISHGAMKTEKVKPGSVGVLAPYMSCKIVDQETGQAVGTNKVGELCFKGPFVTKGYYKNPEATATIIDKDGWLHSGDVGYCDEDGFFFIVDRIKELIKYRGEHIAPVELEALLVSHPAVKEAVVIGIPHDTDQEHPRAFIVKQLGATVTEQELASLVAGELASHKWLRGGVQFLDSLPKSSTGKVKRTELRRMYQNTSGVCAV